MTSFAYDQEPWIVRAAVPRKLERSRCLIGGPGDDVRR
jgi:hypothetical protein